MPIYNNVLELVGNTPVVRLNKLVEGLDELVSGNVGCSYASPGMLPPRISVKDRPCVCAPHVSGLTQPCSVSSCVQHHLVVV